jgi:hypothetical protein
MLPDAMYLLRATAVDWVSVYSADNFLKSLV